MRSVVHLRIAAILTATVIVAAWGLTGAGQAPARTGAGGRRRHGGVVTGPKGPEAGVWVIAETTDLPTRLIRSVVTDDQGRYLLPDLPKASYVVWVRGYGLVDSSKVKAAPGQQLSLTAVAAPDAKAAAHYYPAQYWLAMLQVPPTTDFPGTGPTGNGISPNMRSQGEWIRNIVNTDGCTGCHQLGGKATREIPASLGTFASSERRVGAARAVRPGGRRDARTIHAGRPRTRAGDVGRLDRSHRQGRAARLCAAASAGARAQRRHHDVGLDRSEGVPPRRDRVRQAQPDGKRQRADLRRARGSRGLHAGRRSRA